MTAKEVMEILGVSRVQLSYMVKTGKIATKTIKNGRYDYDGDSVRILAEKGVKKRVRRSVSDSKTVYTEQNSTEQTEEPEVTEEVNSKSDITKQQESPVKSITPSNLYEVIHKDDDIQELNTIVADTYQSNFAIFFVKQREIMQKMLNSQLTDDELQFIMIDVPIQLFNVSEQLQKFKSTYEIIKLKVKGKSKVDNEDLMALKIMSIAYSSVIARVESEISFSKELIMSSKKIWSARRATESSMPVAPIDEEELPDYQVAVQRNQYIK